MLLCISNVLRRPCPSLVAAFSTARSLLNTAPSNFGALGTVLDRVAEEQPPLRKSSFSPNNSSFASSKQGTPWKPIYPNRAIRPHELTYKARVNNQPPRKRRAAVGPPPAKARYNDVFHQFGIDPVSQALNPAILNEYLSEMGKIYGRNITGLTTKSQRRLGKAIRRAKMMGVIPILSKPTSSVMWLPKGQ